ncbi:hypothetical protein AGABI2DRAFT_118987 [Agaricus bisporus var. bisporus H97]|uniref:hypothetical protein n=1 Tax=Agaricus bisporus var. bisporus (strain H97 / ATCC MYA-4626 / FGSC 10389) TaxID=936046 RepID=UPI00029F7498|nr:hypothetical protein AGABI2DRAFT_118987 [Agaricus bisporus var. bisporus H97]EKV46808.1 hypothetical protein AGABI2DRAFT_118987 [Agaricus bisporus var. bisporus H97]
MQEAEEQDTCRICSAPAEPGQPLFHPCKCSGTIRYIHQDCLTTWLAHSKKKTCDVCKHQYSFTKVYAADMPTRLPTVLLARRFFQHALLAILFILRAIAVAIIWLAVLPWVTVWTWRMYFSMGESTAWYISNLERPPGSTGSPHYQKLTNESSTTAPKSIIGQITAHPIWAALSADIFTGQIIASLIVLTFVAVFLLREWISQNARPGVFEDEEVFPDMPPAVNDPPPQPVQNIPAPVAPLALPNPADLERRQQNAIRELEQLRAREEANVQKDEHASKNGNGVGDVGVSKVDYKRKKQRVYASESETESSGEEGLDRRKGKALARTTSLKIKSDSMRRRPVNGPPSDSSTAVEESTSVNPSALQASPFEPHDVGTSAEANGATASPSVPLPSSSFHQSHLRATSLDLDETFAFPPRRRQESHDLAANVVPEELDPVGWSSSQETYEGHSQSVVENEEEVDSEGNQSFTFDASRSFDASLYGGNFEGAAEPASTLTASETSGAPPPWSSSSLPPGIDIPVPQDDLDDVQRDFEGFGSDFNLENEQQHYFRDPEDEVRTPPSLRVVPVELQPEDAAEPHVPVEVNGREPEHDLRRDDDDEDEEEPDEDGDEELWNDDAHWDGIEVQEVAVGQEQIAEGVAAAPDPNPGQGARRGEQNAVAAVNAEIPPEVADDLEGNVEDDMEGAMEAIGMRGPIYSVFQNAALMIFVLDTAIGVGVWIPFMIGRCVAQLSLNPKRIVQILHFPIRLIRIITDPEVDLVIWIIQRVYRDFFKVYMRPVVKMAKILIKNTLGEDKVATYVGFANRTYNGTVHLFSGPSSPIPANETIPAESMLDKIPAYLGPTEPYFALLGREVRSGVTRFKASWCRLAIGSGPTERAFAIGLGYAVIGIVLALYLNVLTIGNARSATRAVRNAVRQQLLVIKVAAFIFIELVLFPLGCGIVLDLCTVWLFPEANLQSRIAFFSQAPLTAMFYHWIAGTMFMYSFAVLLSGCRAVMRPGAMWFIKDPQDQNSHPIRDILDRPTLTQLRKIFMSAILYSVVVACVVGSVAGLLILGNKSILPFRWKNREPLSNVPIDLLFLHLVLPYTMHYFRPKRAIKRAATVVWKYLSRRFRLTSYFFGETRMEEQYTPRRWFGADINDPDLASRRNGTFRRVPATDNLALPRDMRATAQVFESGEPWDERAEKLMRDQNAEALKAKRDINFDYRVVYIPPGFRYRIIGFIVCMWIIGAIVLGFSVALPITLGRSVFRLFTSRDVHDGYSLILGFYLLVACYLCGRAIDRLDKRRQRRSPEGSRADLRVLVIKRGLLWLAKISFMMATLGVVLPILVAIVMDLYVILPVRLALDPSLNPKIRVVDSWALGLLYVKIAIHVQRIQPNSRISRGLHRIMSHGWLRPDPVAATKDVILPVGGGLLAMIVLPALLFQIIRYIFPNVMVDDKFVFVHVYPCIFIMTGLMQSSRYLNDMVASWSQAIRDKEFLVEMRLRNLESDEAPRQEVRREGSGAVI